MATCDQQFSTLAALMFVAVWKAVAVRLWHRVAISHQVNQLLSRSHTLKVIYTLSHWYRTIRVRLVSCLLWGHNRKKYQTTYALSQTVSSTRCDLCVVNGHVAQKHKQHCAQDVLFATHTFARTKHILCDVKHVLGKRSFSWTPCRGQETQSADWDGNAVPSSCKPWLLSCLWRMTLLRPGFWPSGLLQRKPTKVSD